MTNSILTHFDGQINKIPTPLCQLPHWVLWRLVERDGKPAKVPFTPAGTPASVSDPNTWTDFQTALQAYEQGRFDGIGFVLTQEAGIVCVDIDHARNGVGWKAEALEIVRLLDSYTEVSPSGQGLHIWCYGHLPAGRRRKNGVEMYDSGRFITVTGDHLPDTPADLQERTAELMELHRRVFGEETTSTLKVTASVDLSDAELIQRAMDAKDGAKFRALWNGDTSSYPSQSEADLALCRLLGFWTGGDPERIERLFSQSALGQREKWRTRPDYRERTIAEAIGSLRETYNGNGHRQNPRQLRQIDRTDADPSWADNLTTAQESRATDEPGATGEGSRNGHGQSPIPNPFPAGEGDADTGGGGLDLDLDFEIPHFEVVQRPPQLCTHEAKNQDQYPHPLPEGGGESLDLDLESRSRVHPHKSEMNGYRSRNEWLHSAKQMATDREMNGYRSRNEWLQIAKRMATRSSTDIVAEYALANPAFTLSDILRDIPELSRSAARQALYRLVRAGKLELRGKAYSISCGGSSIMSVAEFAVRQGISENAARCRLKRLTDGGRALRLAAGLYFILPDVWELHEAFWSQFDRKRDERGREFVELFVPDLGRNGMTVRLYLSDGKLSALLEASVSSDRGTSSRVLVVLASKPKDGKIYYDCVALISPDRSRILWRSGR